MQSEGAIISDVLVSVVMPVHNGAAYLRQAIDSILGQSLTNFECIIVDDASDDESPEIVRSYNDRRIRLLQGRKRLKICGALNLGLEQAKGRYIARMDADDISRPERFAEQVAYLDANPLVGVCGTWVKRFGDEMVSSVYRTPCGSENIKAWALFDNPFVHSSVMIRRAVLEEHQMRYKEEFRNAEDYELWHRMLKVCRAENLKKVLLDYRVHAASVTTVADKGMDAAACEVIRTALRRLGLESDSETVRFHRYLGTGRLYPDRSRSSMLKSESWLRSLLAANSEQNIYHDGALRRAVAEVWYRICYHSLREGVWIIRRHAAFHLSVCGSAGIGFIPLFFGAAAKSMFRR